MKKVFKSRLFSFILGAFIFSTITTVIAINISANDVTYTNQNGTETTVADELDNIYTLISTSSAGGNIGPNMTVDELMRFGSYLGVNTTKTITNVENYDYYFVIDAYNGGACSSTAGCNNVTTLNFTNASAVELGFAYRLSDVRTASKGYLVFPTGDEDITITVAGAADALVVYGIK